MGVAACCSSRYVSKVSNFRMGQLGQAQYTANVSEAEGNKVYESERQIWARGPLHCNSVGQDRRTLGVLAQLMKPQTRH